MNPSILKCNVCTHRVHTNAITVKCVLCLGILHDKCLYNIHRNDMKYLNANQWLCLKCISANIPFIHIEDEYEFLESIEALEGSKFQNIVQNDLVYQPFQDISEYDENNPLMNIDPDTNYFNEIWPLLNASKCDYYRENSFNKKYEQVSASDCNMSLLHLNIRSARKNLSQLENYLINIHHKFSIIALTETWFREDDCDLYNLYGYTSECVNRTRSNGGGVALLIKNGLFYKRIEELCVANEYCEQLFIEFPKSCFQSEKNIVIGVIYRAPGLSLQAFNDHLIDLFDKLKTEDNLLYMTGDFNVNLLNDDQHVLSSEFVEIFYANSCLPLITKPTRISNTRATLIDNIFTNDLHSISIFHGILYTDISDHLPIFYISDNKKTFDKAKYVTYRDFSSRNVDKFKDKLKNTDWSSVYIESDAQKAYSAFHKLYSNIYYKCFPLKRKKLGYSNRKPWLTEAMKVSIKEKNNLYMQFRKVPSNENKTKYKEYRKCLLRLLSIEERNHYNDLMVKYKNNMKKSWKSIKEIINKKKVEKAPISFMIDKKSCDDKKVISESFNRYFLNIGPTLAKDIPHSDQNPNMYVKNNKNSMHVKDVTQEEIQSIVKNLKDSSPGYDDICPKYVKYASSPIIAILQYVFQLSLNQGIFPTELKKAKVIPLYKSNDVSKLSNYRPVSILPVFSKVLERIMYNRIMDFININNILYDLQFGFRRGHSTNLALIYLIDKITSELNDGNFVLGVFLDLRKAFDTVNHSILLRKLYLYGVRGIAYDWFENYLYERSQFVYFNEEKSDEGVIQCGVPQGSILGPLLFLLYVNDIANVSSIIFPLIFADDTNIFVSGKNVEELVYIMNDELRKITQWMNTNKLSLNIDKSNYMLFHSSRKTIGIHSDVLVNRSKITKIHSTKFLGVIIDDCLKWTDHIKMVKKKVAKAIGILNKARRILNLNTLKIMYNSFVLPHLSYAIEIWGDCGACLLLSLFKMQKKVLRMITSSQPRDPSAPIFASLGLLNIYQLFKFFVILFVYKYKRGFLPCVFDGMFLELSSNHYYNTRKGGQLKIPLYRLASCQKTIRYNAVKYWNIVSEKIDRGCSVHTFKKRLKIFILNNVM